MSFFFLVATSLTYWFSHFWAKRTQPVHPSAFAWTKSFKGSARDFQTRLEAYVKSHPHLLILEKTPHRYLISESPSTFHYGHFYHFQYEEKDGIVLVKLDIQAKLVNPLHSQGLELLENIEDQDVGT